MNLSEAIRSFPSYVSLIALNGSDEGDFEVFAEEERLLPPRASSRWAAGFRLGRRAAHRALEALGHQPRPILRGPGREPLWPKDVVGSITHTGDDVIAAVAYRSDAGGIGIDLEARDRYFPDLGSQVASERTEGPGEDGGSGTRRGDH